MGRHGSSKNLRSPPLFDGMMSAKLSFELKNNQSRLVDDVSVNDPYCGRRSLGEDYLWRKTVLLHGLKNESSQFGVFKGLYSGKRYIWHRKHLRLIGFVLGFLSFLIMLDSLMFSLTRSLNLHSGSHNGKLHELQLGFLKDERNDFSYEHKDPIVLYGRLLNLASSALAEKDFKHDSSIPWEEPFEQASAWKPCADKDNLELKDKHAKSSGFILVSANGGLNQQRVAVCNAVAVASLLNATLVLPKFLYSNVWKDPSQFGDIYQEEYFMNILKDEVNIVKNLPLHLQSLDIEAVGSLITDADIVKEAKPADFVRLVLPLLQENGVVHFLGFGNRLGFDPLSSKLQRLRCKCNFHALKFVPKIQQAGSLLVRRIRKNDVSQSLLDTQLLGDFTADVPSEAQTSSRGTSKYLSLHLRFEIDMVAYSLCDFGGGVSERNELQAYREAHFPILVERLKNTKSVSPEELRRAGRCPLTPEEAGLVLSSLGFKRGTYIYLAGSQLYGENSRMLPFTSLYPNVVTKEDLLTPSELAPFMNFSSQLAALDFIACATADVFAMTDSGSQLSSLVAGYRIYYGGGHAPTLRPNKKRLAAILSQKESLSWNKFKDRVKKMIEEGQRVSVRAVGKSIYRQPRCPECMCKGH
ncbi:O-fucosyltransferase [Thalictrum thalictroides]|uniref:O-fucosyltransferase family protein n=1 Tax=Thalictrum thalictroides TaxID=46969 RepID=A0A7J6WVI4_THATH|nr:O-fucosyltransferase [Thalictrum thalictroides]